jgi:magnesium chelatase subunit I
LFYVEPAITGKIELVYEGEQEGPQNVARLLIGRAIKEIFTRYFPDPADKQRGRETYKEVLNWFSQGNAVSLSPDLSLSEFAGQLNKVAGLHKVVKKQAKPGTPAEAASTMEFVLEALHQNSLVGKDQVSEESTTYNDIMGSMLSSLGSIDDDDDFDEDDFYRRYQ